MAKAEAKDKAREGPLSIAIMAIQKVQEVNLKEKEFTRFWGQRRDSSSDRGDESSS